MKSVTKPMRLRMLTRYVLAGLAMLAVPAQADYRAVVEKDARLGLWLADWLNRLHADGVSTTRGEPYMPGLIWKIPAEVPGQRVMKNDLLLLLDSVSCLPADTCPSAAGLATWVQSLPVTGRVSIGKSDPRWLEVHPPQDPLLRRGHEIVLPTRPHVVAVVKRNGEICHVQHDPSLFALDYLRRCEPEGRPGQAWVIQPDGLVRQFSIAYWNREVQQPPAPGAWILADEHHAGWPESIYPLLARFLATQGPASDGGHLPAPAPEEVSASADPEVPRNLPISASDWGMTGLLQTPTARMGKAGTASIGVSRVAPYTRLSVALQPFDWFEVGFRYNDVSNRFYGATIAGDQSYKDKNVDFKLRLSTETEFMPELAVGVRDVGGTGLFAGEYLVASKRTGNFDWSLGMGWGYLGARGNISNPLGIFGSGFDQRPLGSSGPSGGEFNVGSLFHGPTALFGGVQYQTPWDALLLKLEYDGNDYQHEPQNNNQPQTTPFNLGAVYRLSPYLDLNLAWERGNTTSLGFSFHGPLDELVTPKLNDPPEVAIAPGMQPPLKADWPATATELEYRTRWRVRQIRPVGTELIVIFDGVSAKYWYQKLDRIAAVLHRQAPASIRMFRIQNGAFALKTNEYLVDRATWVDAKTRLIPPSEFQPSVIDRQQMTGLARPHDEVWLDRPQRKFESSVGMTYGQSLGGPDGFVLYQLGVGVGSTLRLRPDTWVSSRIQARLADNYDNFKYDPPPSNLPRVRTYMREFLTTSEFTLPQLQLTHLGQIGRDQYYSLYGGLLENMYGGVGGEWLYRPWGSRLALGMDVNRVRQRGFEQDFSFRDYEATTGHASVYWDTGVEGILATVSAGKYLAGDIGGTLDLSRSFRNGVRIGAFATKTDVSAVEFGEGSFDKGIYVHIPFDAILTRSGSSKANLLWQPLTRDGGARLNRAFRLYDLTGAQSGDNLKWRPFGDTEPDRYLDERSTQSSGKATSLLDRPLWTLAGEDLSLLGRTALRPEFWGYALVAAGATLASVALDDPLDEMAKKHGDHPAMQGAEIAGDFLPIAVLGFSGLASLGTSDPYLSKASLASLEAGTAGLMLALGGKYAAGRARPEAELGNSAFDFFSTGNGDTAFPSIHSTVAWAALTPYAKAYRAPWLYGLAAVTNVARVSGRKHWFSDTVGGAFLGYALGSLFWDARDAGSKSSPKVYLGPREIGLQWRTP